MSLKDKLASILFGAKAKEEQTAEESGARWEQQEDQSAEALDLVTEDPALIKLQGEHPLIHLYGLRRKEAGPLPAPRLCMDEDGVLPEETVLREKDRLQNALKNACNFRMKSMKNTTNRRQKDNELELEPEGLDALPWFFISSDKLCAWAMVFPPTGTGQELTRDMLYQALLDQGIL